VSKTQKARIRYTFCAGSKQLSHFRITFAWLLRYYVSNTQPRTQISFETERERERDRSLFAIS